MTVDVRMPLLGETVEEGTITRWLRRPGDAVRQGEGLFEVTTDKVDSEVPSPFTGTLVEIVAPEQATVAVGAVVARMAGQGVAPVGHTLPASLPAKGEEEPSVHPGPQPIAAVPTAMSLRSDGTPASIDHRRFPPLPPRLPLAAPSTTSATLGADAGDPSAQVSRGPDLARPAGGGGTFVPYTPIRRTIGARMTTSQRTGAHTLVVMEADYEAVHRARMRVREASPAPEGLTYLPFVLHAIVDAIKDFPTVNAHVFDDGVTVFKEVHLGVAVDLDHRGLVVPVLRDAHSLRLLALARAAHGLAERARNGSLGPDDYNGGTITVTNPGGFGTVLGAPIINPPQAAIVETDAVVQKVVPVGPDGDLIAIRRRGHLSMTYDHRAFDGAYASAFLRQVCEIIRERDWEAELVA